MLVPYQHGCISERLGREIGRKSIREVAEVQHLLCLYHVKHNTAHPSLGKSGFAEESAAGNKPTSYLSLAFAEEIHHQQFIRSLARFCLQQNPSSEYQYVNVSMTLYK